MHAPTETSAKVHHPGDRQLMWIATYNFCKGMLLLTIALGLLGFLHKDVDAIVGRWLTALGVSLENVHIAAFLAWLDVLTDQKLRFYSAITFLFAAVFITEGIGLFFKQRWAEYLTVVVTASFIPFEIFECFKHFGPGKFVLLVVNTVIVCSLLWILKKNFKATPAQLGLDRFAGTPLHNSMVSMAAGVTPALVKSESTSAGA